MNKKSEDLRSYQNRVFKDQSEIKKLKDTNIRLSAILKEEKAKVVENDPYIPYSNSSTIVPAAPQAVSQSQRVSKYASVTTLSGNSTSDLTKTPSLTHFSLKEHNRSRSNSQLNTKVIEENRYKNRIVEKQDLR